MADSKISDLAAITTLDGTEEFVVADGGATKKITADNALKAEHVLVADAGTFYAATDVEGVLAEIAPQLGGAAGHAADGWVDDTATTWTYASATTFTVAGVDVTAKFSKGTRLKLTQTTVKYFVVIGSTFSTDTTVTITAGSDYTLANAAITDNYYSYAVNPQGYPGWFSFTPTITGYGSAPTPTTRFRVDGNLCTWYADLFTTTDSNATTYTATMPVTPSDDENPFWAQVTNNGVRQNPPGMVKLNTGGGAADIFLNGNEGAWTAANDKWARFTAVYRI